MSGHLQIIEIAFTPNVNANPCCVCHLACIFWTGGWIQLKDVGLANRRRSFGEFPVDDALLFGFLFIFLYPET